MDEAYMQFEGEDMQAPIPWTVTLDDSIYDPDFGFDPLLVEYAINHWHTCTPDLFTLGECLEGEPGCLVISAGYTGDSFDFDGNMEVGCPGVFLWASYGPVIQYGTIVVSTDITWDADEVLYVLEHELGHALALADDPGPPQTVDLNSTMGSPLVRDGDITYADCQRVVAQKNEI